MSEMYDAAWETCFLCSGEISYAQGAVVIGATLQRHDAKRSKFDWQFHKGCFMAFEARGCEAHGWTYTVRNVTEDEYE